MSTVPAVEWPDQSDVPNTSAGAGLGDQRVPDGVTTSLSPSIAEPGTRRALYEQTLALRS
jgi:hypothetical protein